MSEPIYAEFRADDSGTILVGWWVREADGSRTFFATNSDTFMRGALTKRDGKDVYALKNSDTRFVGELIERTA